MLLDLSGIVSRDMLKELIKTFNELKDDEKLDIYFSTPGGEVGVAEAMIHLINKNKERVSITFHSEVYSAGMMLLLKVECPRIVLPEATGMYHFSWLDLTITEGGKPSDEMDKFFMKQMKNSLEKTISFLRTTKMNDSEIKKIARQKDVYFSTERLKELING